MAGELVKHKKFGQGRIIDKHENHLKVEFGKDKTIKLFVYPDAFESFLTFEDGKLQEEALQEIWVNKVQKSHEIEARKQEYLKAEEEKKKEKKETVTRKRRVTKKNKETVTK